MGALGPSRHEDGAIFHENPLSLPALSLPRLRSRPTLCTPGTGPLLCSTFHASEKMRLLRFSVPQRVRVLFWRAHAASTHLRSRDGTCIYRELLSMGSPYASHGSTLAGDLLQSPRAVARRRIELRHRRYSPRRPCGHLSRESKIHLLPVYPDHTRTLPI
jgi:hypothetical protein